MDKASVDNRAREFLAQEPKLAFIPNEQRLTFEEFKAWYNQHNNKPERSYSDFTYNDTGPMNTPDASYFNKLGYAMGQITNKNIVATIGDAIAKHKKVLVVYGSYHHFVAKPVFEKMFGEKGEIIQLVQPSAPEINYRDDWSQQPRNAPDRAKNVPSGMSLRG